jgi:hypothetical protein
MGIFSAAARRARENTKEEETSKYRSYNKIYMSKGYEFASAFPILMKLMLQLHQKKKNLYIVEADALQIIDCM